MLKCSWAHTLSCLLVYCSIARIGHDVIIIIIIIINTITTTTTTTTTAIELSVGASSPHTSTDKTNENKYT